MSVNHVNVRLNSNIVIIVDIDLSWNIRRLKQEIATRHNLNYENLRIIFAGKELPDHLTMQDTDINQSVVHVIEGRRLLLDAQTEALVPSLTRVSLTSAGNSETPSTEEIPVLCVLRTCGQLCPGKLRVRCSFCRQGSFILQQGPGGWDDVLKCDRISGTCEQVHCPGTTAEFYFKCGNHESLENESATPLSLIKTNTNDIPCLGCEEIQDKVLVYPCSERHTMCLECFCDYCTVKMNERGFVNSEQHGYTLPCPGNSNNCDETYIEDFHHYYLLGDLQYNRLKDFAVDDYILQSGGVFCPGVGCGAGYILAPGVRKVECNKCTLVFCASCHEPFHNGRCNSGRVSQASEVSTPSNSAYRVDPQSANRATQAIIERTTKPCPNCKVPIEKNAGCMHMICKLCKYEFCWMCRTEWSRECQADHWFG